MPKRASLSAIIVILAGFLILMPSPARTETYEYAHSIPRVRPIAQPAQTSWCWLAVLQMLLVYLRMPAYTGSANDASAAVTPQAYQCGILRAITGPGSGNDQDHRCFYSCLSCTQFAATDEVLIKNALDRYPLALRSLGVSVSSYDISSTVESGSISAHELIRQLHDNKPVIAIISTNGLSNHAVLISGYRIDVDDRIAIVIDDPYPYDTDPQFGVLRNPYYDFKEQSPRQFEYVVDYNVFKSRMHWSSTIDDLNNPEIKANDSPMPRLIPVVDTHGFVPEPATQHALANVVAAAQAHNIAGLRKGLISNEADYELYDSDLSILGLLCSVSYNKPKSTNAGSWEFQCTQTYGTEAEALAYYDQIWKRFAASLPAGIELKDASETMRDLGWEAFLVHYSATSEDAYIRMSCCLSKIVELDIKEP